MKPHKPRHLEQPPKAENPETDVWNSDIDRVVAFDHGPIEIPAVTSRMRGRRLYDRRRPPVTGKRYGRVLPQLFELAEIIFFLKSGRTFRSNLPGWRIKTLWQQCVKGLLNVGNIERIELRNDTTSL